MARRVTRFVRPAPRSMIWLNATITRATLTTNTAQLIGQLNAAALLLRPFTIVRTRVQILFISDQTVASEFPAGALGFITVKQPASAIGITAMPTPLTESQADWFVYQG